MHAWEQLLTRLGQELGQDTIDKWLRPLTIVRFDACNLHLQAQDSFQIEWFEEHIRPRVKGHFLNNNHHPIKIHLALESDHHPPVAAPATHIPSLFSADPLDPAATLERFFAEGTNTIPLRIAQEIVAFRTDLLSGYNPLYIHGPTATGKTHLLMGIAIALLKAGKQALYIRAETFTEHVVIAIRNSKMQEFRRAYRHIDALLIDDIHVLARRGATQEELFHTFNTLHTAGKQIVLSAHAPPQLLQAIEPRLVSRFEWGLCLQMEKSPHSALRHILALRAETMDFPLSDELQQFLLKHFGANLHSLLRALETLILRAHMRHVPSPWLLKPMTAAEMLADLLVEAKDATLHPEKIISTVAEFYGIPTKEILGRSQIQECTLPRQVAMHLCRQELKMPYLKIGDIFHRDHTTVMASIQQIQKRLETHDKELAASLTVIHKNLGL